MPFISDGKVKNYIQIGTVMTANEYRNQGLSRYLIEAIIKDYKNVSDGIYLWANDSVKTFYPKYGFQEKKEYQYRKSVHSNQDQTAIKVLTKDSSQYQAFEKVVSQSAVNSRIDMNNPGLIMFYVVNLMGDNIYYIHELDAHVIANVKDYTLFIHHIFAPIVIDLDQVIKSFGRKISEVTLGFTPLNGDGYEVFELHREDSTFFTLGNGFAEFERGHKMFPELSHA